MVSAWHSCTFCIITDLSQMELCATSRATDVTQDIAAQRSPTLRAFRFHARSSGRAQHGPSTEVLLWVSSSRPRQPEYSPSAEHTPSSCTYFANTCVFRFTSFLARRPTPKTVTQVSLGTFVFVLWMRVHPSFHLHGKVSSARLLNFSTVHLYFHPKPEWIVTRAGSAQ